MSNSYGQITHSQQNICLHCKWRMFVLMFLSSEHVSCLNFGTILTNTILLIITFYNV